MYVIKINHTNMIGLVIVIVFLNTGVSTSIAETRTTTENGLHLIYIEKEVDPLECREICGCDKSYIYNDTLKECVINLEYLMESLAQTIIETSGHKYEAADHDIANDDGMAKTIREEAEHIFRGIIISVIIFLACASVCVVTSCIYCCHINYSDRKLKNDVKDMAKKLKKNYNSKRTGPKTRLEPMQESCNVVVGGAGVFVV